MPSNRNSARKQSVKAAFCGMAVGLGTVLMLLGGVIPVATDAVPMLCGVLLLPILAEFGPGTAFVTFLTTALAALLMDMDKEASFFYLFTGYYPILKGRLDRIPSEALRTGAKLGLFAAAVLVMYALLGLLFPAGGYLEEFREMGAALSAGFAVLYLFCMTVYDRLLSRLMPLYLNRIRPRLKWIR